MVINGKVRALALTLLISGCLLNNIASADTNLYNINQVGFGTIESPLSVYNDEFKISALAFALKDEAKRLKDIRIDYDDNLKTHSDALVKVEVANYEYQQKWREPQAETYPQCISVEGKSYTGKDGKSHNYTVSHYTTGVEDQYGKYLFIGVSNVTIKLVDKPSGSTLFTHHEVIVDDKPMDGYRKTVRNFYKALSKAIKKDKKANKGLVEYNKRLDEYLAKNP